MATSMIQWPPLLLAYNGREAVSLVVVQELSAGLILESDSKIQFINRIFITLIQDGSPYGPPLLPASNKSECLAFAVSSVVSSCIQLYPLQLFRSSLPDHGLVLESDSKYKFINRIFNILRTSYGTAVHMDKFPKQKTQFVSEDILFCKQSATPLL